MIVAAIGFYFGSRPGVQEETDEDPQSRRKAIGVDPAPAPAADLASLSATDLVRAAKGRIELTEQMRAALRFEDWAQRDPEGAARAVVEFEPIEWANELAIRVFNTIAVEDPQLAVDLLLELEVAKVFSPNASDGGWGGLLLTNWLHKDFDKAAPSLLARREAIREQFSGSDLFEIFLPIRDDGRAVEVVALLAQMMPEGIPFTISGAPPMDLDSIEPILAIDDPDARDAGIQFMLRYAKTEAAEAWIDLLSDEEARRKGIRALLERLDGREAAAAVKTYTKYAAEFDAAKVDPHLSYILKRTRSAWKGGALPTPDEAKGYRSDLQELLAESIPTSKVPVAQKFELIDALAESETRTAALRSTLVNWLKKEPEAASTWVRDLPPGAYRDTAITTLVQTIAPGDPEAALRWAESLHEPGLRERYTRVALRHWSLNEPESAPGAIDAADLDAAAKQSLLERIKSTDL